MNQPEANPQAARGYSGQLVPLATSIQPTRATTEMAKIMILAKDDLIGITYTTPDNEAIPEERPAREQLNADLNQAMEVAATGCACNRVVVV
jgi:hypothetical protein